MIRLIRSSESALFLASLDDRGMFVKLACTHPSDAA